MDSRIIRVGRDLGLRKRRRNGRELLSRDVRFRKRKNGEKTTGELMNLELKSRQSCNRDR